MFALVPLRNGLQTLRDLETGETFHPVVGPMAEALAVHVSPMNLPARLHAHEVFTIWDIGFGAAANAVAVLETLQKIERPFCCRMLSFDRTLDALEFALAHAAELAYPLAWQRMLGELISRRKVTLAFPNDGKLEWTLEIGDFTRRHCPTAPHAVMYDPYSPVKNPSMWSLQHFARLRCQMPEPASLTSYSRSTAVRVTLLLAGFFVGCGAATGEKEQTTVAATVLDLLREPLPKKWLARVRASTNGRPLGSGTPGKISPDDLRKLESHPQFQDV